MKPCIEPKGEVILRAIKKEFSMKGELLLDSSSTVGLLIDNNRFNPIKYLGTITILGHKVREEKTYEFMKLFYRGKLIKLALHLLGKKRVRVFVHLREGSWDDALLLLGITEGTVVIAPFFPELSVDKTSISFRKVTKFPSSKLVRRLIYASL